MQATIHIAGTAAAALSGFALGGFLNAKIDGWTPREGPRSKPVNCRRCGASMNAAPHSTWFELRRRCPACRGGSALRYPLVALAVGATWAVAAWQALPALYLPGWERISVFDALAFGAMKMILCWMLIGLAVMDAEHRWLPDWFTMGGAALGLAFSIGRFTVYSIWYFIPLHWSLAEGSFTSHRQHLYDAVVRWIAGVVILPGTILVARRVYYSLRQQEGDRAGEAKLMLLLAAWLGFSHSLLAFVLGIFLAAIATALAAVRKEGVRNWLSNMPFASFLCAGGILSGLWGGMLIAAYLRWCDFIY